MHVLFDCDNYNTLQQDTFKKIKATDNKDTKTYPPIEWIFEIPRHIC